MTLGQTSPGRDLKDRYLVAGGAMLVGLLALVIGTYRLQITRYDEFTAKSVANFVKDVRLRATRGMIVDARGEILVDNRPSFDLFVTPGFCEGCQDQVLPALATYLRWTPEETAALWQRIRAAKRDAPYVQLPVKIDLGRDEADLLAAHQRDLPGFEVVGVPHRNYHTGAVLSHVLGYMNEINQDELDRLNQGGPNPYLPGDYIGRRGLERYFEARLRGVDGVRKEVVNARGEAMPELSELIPDVGKPATPGNNLVLSIDMRLQAEAEKVFPGEAGAVVAIDVRTGFIKAIVSRPGYDPNALTGRITPVEMAALSKDPLQPMIFRPTQQHYSPGSTFKPFAAMAAMRAGKFTPNTVVNCPGGYRLGSRVWRCDLERGHGPVSMHEALQKSCDVYFYKLGDTIGIDALAETGRLFGLGTPTGIGVVAEVPGIMPDSAYYERAVAGGYQKGMALNSAIGQGDDNVTPLQLAMAYTTIANGGTLYQPQLVTRIETPSGQLVQEFGPKVRGTVKIEPAQRRVILDALKAVVNEPGGTGFAARLPNVVVAGKTGTAQVVRLGTVRLKAHQVDYWHRDNAWFASFAPADDPEIVVVVLNEHAGFGASGAAPVAGKVLKKYFELKAEDSGVAVAATGEGPAAPAASQPVPAKALEPAAPVPVATAQPASAPEPHEPVAVTAPAPPPAATEAPAPQTEEDPAPPPEAPAPPAAEPPARHEASAGPATGGAGAAAAVEADEPAASSPEPSAPPQDEARPDGAPNPGEPVPPPED